MLYVVLKMSELKKMKCLLNSHTVTSKTFHCCATGHGFKESALPVSIINFQLHELVACREKYKPLISYCFHQKMKQTKTERICFRTLCMQHQLMKWHWKTIVNTDISSISVVLPLVFVWSIFSCVALWCSMLVMNGLSFSTLPYTHGFITFQSTAMLLKKILGKLYYSVYCDQREQRKG